MSGHWFISLLMDLLRPFICILVCRLKFRLSFLKKLFLQCIVLVSLIKRNNQVHNPFWFLCSCLQVFSDWFDSNFYMALLHESLQSIPLSFQRTLALVFFFFCGVWSNYNDRFKYINRFRNNYTWLLVSI